MTIPKSSSLGLLVRLAFSDYEHLTRAAASPNGYRSAPTAERIEELMRWWAAHSEMPAEEIDKLLAIEFGKRAAIDEARSTLKESQRFFNRPDAKCDVQHWARMAHWSIDEAIALSLGKNPKIVNWKSVEPHVGRDIDGFASPFAADYDQRLQVAKRAIPWKELFEPVMPAIFIRWAERKGYSFPVELRALVEAQGPISDWKDVAEKQVEVVAKLKLALAAEQQISAKQKEAAEQLEKQCHELISSGKEVLAQLASVRAERDELREAFTSPLVTSQPWPWGEHDTELLQHLAAAGKHWWVNFDPSDPTTAPTNATVVEWIKGRKLANGRPISDRVAEIMAQVLRADGLPTGPRK